MYFGFYCIILHFTQRFEFAVFRKSVCFRTLISVENSHFNEYSVLRLGVRKGPGRGNGAGVGTGLSSSVSGRKSGSGVPSR